MKSKLSADPSITVSLSMVGFPAVNVEGVCVVRSPAPAPRGPFLAFSDKACLESSALLGSPDCISQTPLPALDQWEAPAGRQKSLGIYHPCPQDIVFSSGCTLHSCRQMLKGPPSEKVISLFTVRAEDGTASLSLGSSINSVQSAFAKLSSIKPFG